MGAYDQYSSKNKDGSGSKRKNRRNGASPGGQAEKTVFTADKAEGDIIVDNQCRYLWTTKMKLVRK
jgi:hypothetical protein